MPSVHNDYDIGIDSLCPRCHAKGHIVAAKTVSTFFSTHDQNDAATYRYCATDHCEVIYYSAQGEIFRQSQSPHVFFQKSCSPDRLVCYCFSHTVKEVRAAGHDFKTNVIVTAITSACRAGQDDCERKNPQGRCCLGNIRSTLSPSREKSPSPPCCALPTRDLP